ncbi:MAG: hypothetical protein RL347_2280 [Actinomycetota bacterium]
MSAPETPPATSRDRGHVTRNPPQWRRRVGRALLIAGLVAWWFAMGPVTLGGPATFAVVDGISMEPTMQGGDLVVARAHPSYQLGDTVIFPVGNGRVVIHRLIAGSAEAGWTTQGDNNAVPDPWVLQNVDILGSYWFDIPDVGEVLLWTRRNPLLFGLLVASLVVGISVAGRRRSRVPPAMQIAIADGQRAARRAERPAIEMLVCWVAAIVTALMIVTLVSFAAAGFPAPGTALAAAVLLSLAAAAYLLSAKRLADGWGVPEPLASSYALSSRCWEVEMLPEVADIVECRSALDLRAVTEKGRLPILRRRNGDGTATYLTITVDGIGYRWTAGSALAADGAGATV